MTVELDFRRPFPPSTPRRTGTGFFQVGLGVLCASAFHVASFTPAFACVPMTGDAIREGVDYCGTASPSVPAPPVAGSTPQPHVTVPRQPATQTGRVGPTTPTMIMPFQTPPAAPSANAAAMGAAVQSGAARTRDQLYGMSFDEPVRSQSLAPDSTAGAPVSTGAASTTAQPVLETASEIRDDVATIVSDADVAKNLAAWLDDPKGEAINQLKSLAGDVGDRAMKLGLALAIDNDLCDGTWQDSNCLSISQVAADVVTNIGEFTGLAGLRDRITTFREGLTGFDQGNLNEFNGAVGQIRSGSR
jgi:hypothetical protein